MASITRTSSFLQPSCSLRYLGQQQVRCLSTSQSRSAAQPSAATMASSAMRNMPKQPSMQSRMKKLKRSELPSDIGIIQDTYIRPCGELPSWFSETKLRARLEYLYLKQSTLDFIRFVYMERWNTEKDPLTGRKKKARLGLRERYTAARDLHTQLYNALAERDKTTLKRIACQGLAQEQAARMDIAHITDEPIPSWSVKYSGWVLPASLWFTVQSLVPSFFKSIHIVADRQAQIPIGPGVTVRQVIARIDSKQVLDKDDGTKPDARDVREYFVIQKMTSEGENDGWKVWGTVNPTDTKSALQIMDNEAAGESLSDKIKERMQNISNVS